MVYPVPAFTRMKCNCERNAARKQFAKLVLCEISVILLIYPIVFLFASSHLTVVKVINFVLMPVQNNLILFFVLQHEQCFTIVQFKGSLGLLPPSVSPLFFPVVCTQ